MSDMPQTPGQNPDDENSVSDLHSSSTTVPDRVNSGWRTFSIVMVTILVTLGVGYWAVSTFLFPTSFTPVQLTQKEKTQLDQKLEQVGINSTQEMKGRERLTPEPYSEVGASRDVYFTEKELNALLASNTDLGSQMVIDLSDDLASVKMLIDLDPDFPVIGGKTLKITSGVELSLNSDNPRVILKGVSVWGVPLPDAWLGNLKNVDLLKEFGHQKGFWQSLKGGIETMTLEEGKLRIKLKE